MDFVIIVCINAATKKCRYSAAALAAAHLGLPDPAAVDGSDAEKALAFADIYRALTRRVQTFAAMAIAALDALSVKMALAQIGKTE